MCCWGSGEGTGVRRTGRFAISLERFFGATEAGLGFALEAFAFGAFRAGAFALTFTFTAFLSDFDFALKVFFFPIPEGFFLAFFNASPAYVTRNPRLWSDLRAVVILTLCPGRFEEMIPKMEHFQYLFVTSGLQ